MAKKTKADKALDKVEEARPADDAVPLNVFEERRFVPLVEHGAELMQIAERVELRRRLAIPADSRFVLSCLGCGGVVVPLREQPRMGTTPLHSVACRECKRMCRLLLGGRFYDPKQIVPIEDYLTRRLEKELTKKG